MKTPREVVQDRVAAYNQRDAHAAAELYHENATNLQVALGNLTIGRRAMLEDLHSFFNAFPDNFTHIENLFADWEWAMLECFGGGTWQGEFGGMAPNGRSYMLGGCGFFHVPDGRIRSNAGISIRPPGLVSWASRPAEDTLPEPPDKH